MNQTPPPWGYQNPGPSPYQYQGQNPGAQPYQGQEPPPTQRPMSALSTISLVVGILVFVGMLVALIPCLGWANWGVLPLAAAGTVWSGIGVIMTAVKQRAGLYADVIGLILCILAGAIGTVRLVLGGGIL